MSGIHEAFQGHVPYQFTTLKVLHTQECCIPCRQQQHSVNTNCPFSSPLNIDLIIYVLLYYIVNCSTLLQDLRDPLEELAEAQQHVEKKKEKAPQSNTDR